MQGLEEEPAAPVHIHSNCELRAVAEAANGSLSLKLWHSEIQQEFTHMTKAIVLATGYKAVTPSFIEPLRGCIQFDKNDCYQINRNYSVDRDQTIFIQNADAHTHGLNSADLGMGPYRNAVIINTILGKEHFNIESAVAFQTFGIPS
ncbi:MAG: hypothetical protein QM768_12480 [Agriterribacter sp.]